MNAKGFSSRFSKVDSFANWYEPENSKVLEKKDQPGRNEFFEKFYKSQPLGFPKNKLKEFDSFTDEQWRNKTHSVKFVLVGLNPGNAGVGAGRFNNFHGDPASKDYNIQVLVYGTPIDGAFMTDLNQSKDESDSSKIKIQHTDIENLYDHLENLEISDEAIIIAMHSKVRDALKTKFAQNIHPFDKDRQYIAHYSYRYKNRDTTSVESRKTLENLY